MLYSRIGPISEVEDFLKDDDFIKYVLDDAPESAFHWDKPGSYTHLDGYKRQLRSKMGI